MGLFSKVFSKETCISCGKEVGSLNRKRLGDEAVLCKECAKQLSPFFSDFKGSTADGIRAQLEARARNRELLRSFNVDESFGEGDKILVDRRHGLFCVVGGTGGKSVVSGAQLVDGNPDLVELAAIEDAEVEGAGYSGREVKHTVNGEQVSYNPRRYEYPCNVRLHLTVDHPYIRAMSADMTNGTIYIQTEGERLRTHEVPGRTAGQATADWLLGRSRSGTDAELWEDNSAMAQATRPLTRAFGNVLDDHPDYAYGFRCSRENWPRIQEYGRCMQAAEQAREALLAGPAAQPLEVLAAPLLARVDEAAIPALAEALHMRVASLAAGETIVRANAPIGEAMFVATGRIAAGMATPDTSFAEAMATEAGRTFAVREALMGQGMPLDIVATQESTVVFFRIDNATAATANADPGLATGFATVLNNAMQLA